MLKKKGAASNLIWIYRIILLVIMLGGAFLITNAAIAKQYDTRQVEASIVAENIANCMIDNGRVFSIDIKNCNLKLDENEFYVNISLEKDNKELTSSYFGKTELEVLCQIDKSHLRYPPSCLEQGYYVWMDGKSKLNILVGILKLEENI